MDDLDRAKDLEMQHRAASLAAQQQAAQETETPIVRDGVNYCIDCLDVIPKERIKARPESVRCIDCKELKEQQDRNHR